MTGADRRRRRLVADARARSVSSRDRAGVDSEQPTPVSRRVRWWRWLRRVAKPRTVDSVQGRWWWSPALVLGLSLACGVFGLGMFTLSWLVSGWSERASQAVLWVASLLMMMSGAAFTFGITFMMVVAVAWASRAVASRWVRWHRGER